LLGFIDTPSRSAIIKKPLSLRAAHSAFEDKKNVVKENLKAEMLDMSGAALDKVLLQELKVGVGFF